MPSQFRLFPQIEALEARIAPAVLINPLADIVAGSGKTGATIDLSKLTDPGAQFANHTIVEFVTNVDADPDPNVFTPGVIRIELFDDAAPLSVQNFLSYVNSSNPTGDYDNTIVHRSEPGFVIQGGGYDATSPRTHIPTATTVHNEADPVNRPNLRGTIAMAKIGGDPNSASSEWFINLADNRNPLDVTEGGYTVFGEVISGMEYVDAIAGLPRANFGGALSTLPTQNYDSDPDDNPFTPAPAPTADQLVRIVDARVVPTPGSAPGITYAIESIVAADSTTPSNAVTGKITGQTLTLKYTGKSGLAEVTVKATPSDGSAPVIDTFRVDVRPNLLVDIDSTTLPGLIVPGDLATAKFHLTNNGAALATGKVNVEFTLVKLLAQTSNGTVTGFGVDPSAEPVSLGTLSNLSLNLAGGKTLNLTQKFAIPTSFVADDPSAALEGTAYRVVAKVTPVQGDILTAERFSDDNTELFGSTHLETNRFGTFTSDDVGNFASGLGFGSRTNAILSHVDALQPTNRVTFSIKGPGTGRISPIGDSLGLEVEKSDLTSVLSATLGKGSEPIDFASVQLYTRLGTANLAGADLRGTFAAAAGVKTLVLGDVLQSTILLGTLSADNSAAGTVTLARVIDTNLESLSPLTSLTAVFWLDTLGDTILAPALGSLKITGNATVRGDFEADVTITGDTALTSLSVAGLLRDSTIRTNGNVAVATVGGIESSNLFAGLDELPDDLGDFDQSRTIQSFTVKGIKGYTGSLFVDSNVAAQTIGSIKVLAVNPASGTDPFGFVADVIKKYSRKAGAAVIKTAANVIEPQVIEDEGNYLVQVL
jgi:cyclophilin family peptidyl-prolyl cis-trans isomerase